MEDIRAEVAGGASPPRPPFPDLHQFLEMAGWHTGATVTAYPPSSNYIELTLTSELTPDSLDALKTAMKFAAVDAAHCGHMSVDVMTPTRRHKVRLYKDQKRGSFYFVDE